MRAGRKPLPASQNIEVRVNHEAVAADSAAADGDNAKRLSRIEELYGDGDVYNRESCIQKALFFLNESSTALLDAGKQLILLKEYEPHGDFLVALERIGMPPRAAQKLMQATVKFSSPQMRRLTAHLDSKTKLLELLSEEDQELEELAKGGTLAGLTLDDVERMSATALRTALRAERQKRADDQATNERLIANKNKKLDEYEKRHQGLPAKLRELQIDCARASGECINGVQMFTQIRLATMELLNGDGRDRNDDEVLGAIGATHLQLIWQVQAWLTEEMQWSEQVFGGSRVQVRMENERGPALTDDEILNLKNTGADEAARVAGPRVAEEIIARRQERAANKKPKVDEEAL